jgi:hypothetical protein
MVALLTLIVLAAGTNVSDAEAQRVTVALEGAERFTDFGLRCSGDPRAVEALRAELVQFLTAAAAPYVPAATSLAITVTDVDMAGEFEAWRGPRFCDVRVMREIYAPRIRLTFRLADDTGRAIREGSRDLRDATYLTGAAVLGSDPLRYEKALLRDWLRKEFGGTGALDPGRTGG